MRPYAYGEESKKSSKYGIGKIRPTLESEDIYADRSVWHMESGSQELPKGDNRHRKSFSVKFYLVQLIGEWVHVSESAERTVRSRSGLRWVTFENREYELKKAENFKEFVGRFIKGGCYARIGGKKVRNIKELNFIESQPFIYIASSESLRVFKEMQVRNKDFPYRGDSFRLI